MKTNESQQFETESNKCVSSKIIIYKKKERKIHDLFAFFSVVLSRRWHSRKCVVFTKSNQIKIFF